LSLFSDVRKRTSLFLSLKNDKGGCPVSGIPCLFQCHLWKFIFRFRKIRVKSKIIVTTYAIPVRRTGIGIV